MRNNSYRRGCTIPYAPPEQVRQDKYNEKTDVFSVGVMLFEFVFDMFPVEVARKGRNVYLTE